MIKYHQAKNEHLKAFPQHLRKTRMSSNLFSDIPGRNFSMPKLTVVISALLTTFFITIWHRLVSSDKNSLHVNFTLNLHHLGGDITVTLSRTSDTIWRDVRRGRGISYKETWTSYCHIVSVWVGELVILVLSGDSLHSISCSPACQFQSKFGISGYHRVLRNRDSASCHWWKILSSNFPRWAWYRPDSADTVRRRFHHANCFFSRNIFLNPECFWMEVNATMREVPLRTHPCDADHFV